MAGVIHGHCVLTGSKVTIISPLANPSRTFPVDSSIVLSPVTDSGVSVTTLFGISITAGCDIAGIVDFGFGDVGVVL